MKHILISIFATILFAIVAQTAHASPRNSGASATMVNMPSFRGTDDREKILTAYLKKYNSPLIPYVHTFIDEADRNDLDYRLLVSISGVESTFGKAIPMNSYNGWGWGIYGTNSHAFTSWNEAIITISSELRTRYMDKWGAKDVYAIGKYYASSPTWASRVTYFMNDIQEFGDDMQNKSLSISL